MSPSTPAWVGKVKQAIAVKETLPLIQGIKPGSVNESCTARAFDQLKMYYQYQVPLGGGRSRRGGQVIDFVAWTSTGPVAVFVMGKYWHGTRRTSEDLLHEAAARQRYGRVAILEEKETMTVAQALRAIRMKVGL